MIDRNRLIEAWEIFRDSNPYEICSGCEFRAISEPEYCMGQMIEDTIALLDECDTQLQYRDDHIALYEAEINRLEALLKEQEDVQWINVKDKLPEKDGQYLVVYTFFDYRGMGIVGFSHNLHEIDEYIFNTESRPGWYQSDNEVGYYEKTTVTHWAKLPEFPKEGR